MSRIRLRRPSPSLVISIIALIVALGGTATAAVIIRSSAQIANGAVTSADVKDGSISRRDIKDKAVDSAKIANGSVGIDDLSSPARAAIQNAGTQALEAFRTAGPANVEPNKSARVVTLSNIPPGTYAIFAKTVITATPPTTGLFNQGQTLSGHCKLDAGGDTDESRALLGTPGANSPGEVTTQITRTYAQSGEASLTCDVQPATWSATNSTIIAIRLGAAPRQPVDG
jgi:hypothetical protein